MTAIKRVVVKLGTSVLTDGSSHLSRRRMLEIVQQLAQLYEQGKEVVVVTSGAMAAGRDVMSENSFGRNIPVKQMLSAIGQPMLINIYSDRFSIFHSSVAQVLLTRSDLGNRLSYLNSRETLEALLTHRIVPIVNENDTVATEEIRLGDNDNLSAHVANLIDADLLILLTDQPGLYTTDPRSDPSAKLIQTVEQIDDSLFEIAGGAGTSLGTGGMVTKIEAARLATRSGTTVVIASGSQPSIILDIVGEDGREKGTWFESTVSHLESFRRWMLSEQPQGKIHIDAGAVAKIQKNKVSLLPIGVTNVEGDFDRGVVVSIVDPDCVEIARGVTKYSAHEIDRIKGIHSEKIEEMIGYTYGDQIMRRDQIVLV